MQIRSSQTARWVLAIGVALLVNGFAKRCSAELPLDSVANVSDAHLLLLSSAADDDLASLLDQLMATGRAALQRGAARRAEILFRAIAERDVNRQDAVEWLATALLLQDKTEEAIGVLQEASRRFPASARISMLLGRTYLEQEDHDIATGWFEYAYSLDPCLPDIGYYVGGSYLRCGYPLTALQILSGAPTSRDEVSLAQDLVTGVALGQLGLQREANGYFMHVTDLAMETELAGQAEEMQRQMNEALFGRPSLRGSLKVTERYDSNPAIIPEANTFGTPLRSTPSAGNQYVGTFSYDLLRDYNLDVTTGYTLLHTSNYEIHEYDLLDNAVYLAAARRRLWRGRPLSEAIRIDYDHLGVGGDSFLQRLQVSPSLTFTQSDFDATTLLMRYMLYDFVNQSILEGTPYDQDADNLMFGISHQHRLSNCNMTVFGSYQYDRMFAEGSNFDYQGHKLVAGLQWQLPWHCMELDVTGNLYFRDYCHPNSIFDVRRRDDEYFMRTRLIYPLADQWRMSLEWNFDRNEANLPINDYRRDVLDVGFEYVLPVR